ncbi:hypothetical protein SELMODRAFT_267769 [Selaginella moellendorffii]|uniref:Nitronate monooxygenase domain-containing protein n=1 Tax=Selaginella moellendorffii TaxID=88036 RepID=D8RTU3_SELML|nr:uncharacterized protein LOC9636443 [Selaginella moellendorffii]EFJ24571.1 hypothetical protein SELMODRAFT_267769 [Selaginella moellendorffii]|eukprot:XP_002974349.1 uncharacterized protein LOC9636443 [Selaginella moellendorffii]
MAWGGLLGFDHGIIQAPLGPDISGPALVAAVANAGAIGVLRAPDQDEPEVLRGMVKRTRELTDRSFGVGIILDFPHEKMLEAVIQERVAVLMVYWGEFGSHLVDKMHQAGVKVVHQVGSVAEAKDAALAGVDAIIVQGVEAGGHVRGKEGLIALLPKVVDAVWKYKIPVIAAGGIVDARGYVAALALGAKGVCLGTRFLATLESNAHPIYKKMVLAASAGDTELNNIFGRKRWPNAPQRVIKTPFFLEWRDKLGPDESEQGQVTIGETIVHGKKEEVKRFSGKVPNSSATGKIEEMAMYAGEGVGLIDEILPAASVVRGLVEGAQNIIRYHLQVPWDDNANKPHAYMA